MRYAALVVTLAGLFVSSGAQAQAASVESMPPVVVKTVPQAGDLAVDPGLKTISVTFSKDMLTAKMWSWVQANPETFPKVAGEAHYLADKRTCVLPVELRPGQTYVLWINSPQHDHFRDLGQRPAVPYLLVFKTRG